MNVFSLGKTKLHFLAFFLWINEKYGIGIKQK